MSRKKKTEAFPRVKVSDSEHQEVMQVIDVLDIPFAQFAREAYREKITELKRTHPLLQQSEQIELSK